MRRIILAFAVAPLAVPIVLVAAMLARGASRDQWILAPIATAFAYGVILIGGVPVVFLHRAMGWSRAWQFALGGFVLGVVAFIGFATDSLRSFAFFGGLGALTAAAFWTIGVRGNPAFALRWRPAGVARVLPSPLPTADDIRRAASAAHERVRPIVARACQRFDAWRRPAQTPTGVRPPRAGLIAVAIPLVTTVGTLPWLLPVLHLAVVRLHVLGLILELAYVGLVIGLSGLAVVAAIVAIVLRERFRFWLAAAAVALAALGLAIMRAQF